MCVCVCVSICGYAHIWVCVGVHGGQKKASDTPGTGVTGDCAQWMYYTLPSTESSLHPVQSLFNCCWYIKYIL